MAVVFIKVDPTPFIGEFAGRSQVVWDVGHAECSSGCRRNFWRSSSSVSVVTMDALFGVPRVLLDSWTSARLHCASWPRREMDAAESSKAVVLFGLCGLEQPGLRVS